jgi:hypothetical protein
MLIIFVLFFIFFNYFFSLSRVIFGGDSAEFLTVIATKSIAHPPGYPLYTLIGILFDKILFFLPYLSRINLISVLSVSLSCFFIYRILLSLKLKKPIAIYVAVFFSTIYLVWLYAIVAEVFSLHLLLITLLIYAGFQYSTNSSKRHLILFYLILGLGLAHHHTIVLFALPFVLTNKKFFGREIVFAFVFVPFYLYPLIASSFNPPIDWENSKNIIGLLRLITRYSYGITSPYFQSIPNLVNQLTILLSTFIFILGDFKPLSIFFILIGFFFSKKFLKKNYKSFLLIFIFYLIFLYLTNFNLSQSFSQATFERFLIPFYLILIFYFSFGIQLVYQWLSSFTQKYKKKYLFTFSSMIYWIVLIFLILNNYFLSLANIISLNKDDVYKKFVYQLLSSLPKNSILLLKSDLTYFPLSYFYYVKKERQDIVLIFPGMLTRDYYLQKMRTAYPDINFQDGHRISNFLINNKNRNIFTEIAYPSFYFAPYGYLLKFYPSREDLKRDMGNIIDFNIRFWQANIDSVIVNNSQQRILFLKALSEYKQEKLLQFFYFLKDNNKIKEINSFKKTYQRYCSLFYFTTSQIFCSSD